MSIYLLSTLGSLENIAKAPQMSLVSIQSGTLISPLWPKDPLIKGNGLMLTAALQDGASFTRSDISPFESSRFAAGTSDGAIYIFIPKKNKLVLVAHLAGPISALCWVKPEVLVAASQQAMHLIAADAARVEKRAKSPHMNAIVDVSFHSDVPAFAASISRETLAVWDLTKFECRCNTKQNVVARASSEFVSVAMQGGSGGVVTVEASGVVTLWGMHGLTSVKRVSVAPHRPSSMSWFHPPLTASSDDDRILIGTLGNQLIELDSALRGVSLTQLPGSGSVVATSIIEGELLVAQTSEGHAWFVAAADHGVSFSLSHGSSAAPVDFGTGGATYAVVLTRNSAFMYHLPTVKRSYDRTISVSSSKAMSNSTAATSTSLLPFVRKSTDTGPEIGAHQSESFAEPLPRGPVQVAEGSEQDWIKVNLATHHDAVTGVGYPQPMGLREAVKEMNVVDAIAGKKAGASKCSVITSKQSAQKAPTSKSSAYKGSASNKDDLQADSPSNVSLRVFLDHESRVVNMDKLRVMLLRYGVFPEKYRSLIWRFLLQLPEKKFLAPQFANLCDKGRHPGTTTLMKPFPLPDKKIRSLLDSAVSILAWSSPVFGVAHFTPTIVFPFVKMYGSDLQSAVEVTLAFTINWGQEFFKYYPHHPVAVVSFLNHMLKLEDAELWAHLDQVGVGPEVWGWLVLCPIYTEILTRNEWLQVMDHAFANEPIWLFLFHVRWMCQIRGPLLQLHDYTQLCNMFRKTSPVNLNAVIHQTYRLQQRCVHSDLTEPYRKINTFPEGSYPVLTEFDDAIITSKVREVEKIAAHESEAQAVRSRIAEVQRQTIQSAMVEDAFVGRQRAVVAAKLESANETWVMQVQMEKEKQRLRDIEHEARLAAVQEQLRTAQRLEALQMELCAASGSAKDADIDRQREETKWSFAERMSAQEIDRLEIGARMKLATMMATANVIGGNPPPPEILQTSYGGAGGSSSSIHQHHVDPSSNSHRISLHHPSVSPTSQAAPKTPVNEHPRPAVENHQRPKVISRDASTEPPQQGAVPREQGTMTEQPLPPVAPPQQRQPSVGTSVPAKQSSTSTSDTSVPTSSCDADPIHYYRQLQGQIKERVEQTQREQQEALSALRSRFARQLVDESSSAAAPDNNDDDDDDRTRTTTTTTTTTMQQQREVAQKYTYVTDEQQHVHYSTVQDDASRVAGCTYAESNDSSSISRALLRPQNPQLFDLKNDS